MSHVELPLVPSARSASASSSRSSLRSAGSAQSAASGRSQRSLADTLSDDDEQQEDDGQGEEEPQEASGGLWDEVESFLNKPSPSLSALAKAAKKPSAGTTQTKSVLPTLKAEAPRRSSQGDNQGGRPSRPTRVATASGGKTIDPKLLEEAFAYARRAQAQMMTDEDADGDELPTGGRARPSRRPSVETQDHRSASSSSLLAGRGDSSGNPRVGKSREADKPKKKISGGSSSGGAYAGVARKKSERRPVKEWKSAADEGGAEGERKGRAAGLDAQTVQELVSNLQQGTALEELRRELAASQQSLAQSRQVLHEAAKTFFQPS